MSMVLIPPAHIMVTATSSSTGSMSITMRHRVRPHINTNKWTNLFEFT